MDESQGYNWDDFKAEQATLQRSVKTDCPICYAKLVANDDGKMVCPNGCEDNTQNG